VSDELDDERENSEARDDARKEETLGKDVVVSHGSTIRCVHDYTCTIPHRNEIVSV
jgi:hypothetical protein